MKVTTAGDGLTISPGRYFVDGILCENEAAVTFDDQPDRRDVALVAVGDFDADRIEELAREHLATIPAAGEAPPVSLRPAEAERQHHELLVQRQTVGGGAHRQVADGKVPPVILVGDACGAP